MLASLCRAHLVIWKIVIRVGVDTKSQRYEALIEQGVLRSTGTYVRELMPNARRVFTVTVAPVRKHYGKAIAQSFADAKLDHEFLEMPDGERRKNLDTVEDLGAKLVRSGADRNSVVLALGGGVVGDVAGFLASIYMRGVEFVQVPTTFLAQVDSSVGGKTGVNLTEGKNLLGTFKQPKLVLIDPDVLTTLPERDYRSGLYEALKYGIIRNPRIFEFMEENRDRILKRDAGTLEWLIAECVRVKASVVGADEHEHGERRILNLGHTIGHALEAETGYKHFMHGEAVAWGMVAASMISVGMQKTDSRTAQRIISAILAYAPLPKVDVRSKAVLKRLGRDKKTMDGKVHFILPTQIGQVEIEADVPERAVLQAVEEIRYLSQA
jgi:3-dehydroquinate synthase